MAADAPATVVTRASAATLLSQLAGQELML